LQADLCRGPVDVNMKCSRDDARLNPRDRQVAHNTPA